MFLNWHEYNYMFDQNYDVMIHRTYMSISVQHAQESKLIWAVKVSYYYLLKMTSLMHWSTHKLFQTEVGMAKYNLYCNESGSKEIYSCYEAIVGFPLRWYDNWLKIVRPNIEVIELVPNPTVLQHSQIVLHKSIWY